MYIIYKMSANLQFFMHTGKLTEYQVFIYLI